MSTHLSLLQLNIEYGGTGVSFDAVIDTIRSTSAPVAALQEGCGRVPEIAAALGWPYFDNRTQVVSQFPLLDPPEPTAGVVYVELERGQVVAIINVHPASRGYGPTRLMRGERLPRVLRRESGLRVRELQPSLDAAEALMRDGVPVILLGDFNAPSHLDWTEPAIGLRPHMTAAVPWPTSLAVEEVGLVDVYRSTFTDPVAHPGLTWPAHRPHVKGYNPAANGHPADRIDFMHVSPDIAITGVAIVGEAGSPFSDRTFDPWPTDHRGLLASLEVAPVSPLPVASVSRRLVPVGEDVVVRTIAPDVVGVVCVRHSDNADAALVELSPGGNDDWHLSTAAVGVGAFDVIAVGGDGRESARAALWVSPEGAEPVVETDRSSYEVGDAITVSWSGTPGNRADWLSVHARGGDPASAKRLLNAVTGATIEGTTRLDAISHPRRWPLAPGAYTVYLLEDDLPVQLASTDFDVI